MLPNSNMQLCYFRCKLLKIHLGSILTYCDLCESEQKQEAACADASLLTFSHLNGK